MCGIIGIADRDGVGPDDLAAVRRGMERIRHRGPDGEGSTMLPGVVLGHRRLSILDIGGGAQPMSTPDGRLTIVFNGEVYNFRDLTRELTALGHRFRTTCDTEVLLAAFAEWGSACLDRLNGMFGFAVHDRGSGETFLARDRLGVKPVYYAQTGSRLLFASELAPFAELGLAPEIDLEALDGYLANRYVTAPLTLFAGVRKLPPGHFLRWRDGKARLSRWWDIPTDRRFPGSLPEAGEELASLLADAVRLRLVADVPVGVMLSGGLDSTIITALAREKKGAGIETFAVATSGDGPWDERAFARLAAKRYETRHHEMVVDPEGYVESLPEFARQMDDLVADPASILLWHLSGLARRHVTVALSGEGSDEILAGYNYYLMNEPWRRQQLFNRVPRPLLPLARAAAVGSPRLRGYVDRYRRPRTEFAAEYRGLLGRGLDADLRGRLPRPGLRYAFGRSKGELARPFYVPSRAATLVEDCLYADGRTWLPDNLLTKADRMSMAHGLELRVPFLDYRIVELCFSLPIEAKQRREPDGSWTRKAILRDAFADRVPPEILNRPKQGFTLNWEEILVRTGADLARDVLLGGGLDDLFERRELEGILDRAKPDDPDASHDLLSLVLLGLWRRHFRASVPGEGTPSVAEAESPASAEEVVATEGAG